MIYACEWYDIPRGDFNYLIAYHPYLTIGDSDKISSLDTEHMVTQGGFFFLAGLIANRSLDSYTKGTLQKYMKQRYLRAPVAMLMGGLFAFGVN